MTSAARNVRFGFVVGIVGAESTGKTVLASDLAQALGNDVQGGAAPTVALVGEYLREFCELHGRTPMQHEQRGIADEQARRIDAAAAAHDIVVADTTSLMIAVYSEVVFGDLGLYPAARQAHRRCNLTLLTALDLPWREDGLQRDGPHVREPVDALVRAALDKAGLSYSVVVGEGPARIEAALAAVRWVLLNDGSRRAPMREHEGRAAPVAAAVSRWASSCERCGDAMCERHLFRASN